MAVYKLCCVSSGPSVREFETFVPVKNLFYSLWINCEQELGLSLVPDQLIYVVPNNQSLTSYVFTAELMKYVLVCVCVCLGVYVCLYVC